MGASMMAAGARTQRSLNTVTVSARSISGPDALTIGNSEHALTRMVAVASAKMWSTSTGKANMVASMRNERLGLAPKVLTCSPVNAIHGLLGPPRIRPWMSARKLLIRGWPTAPDRRRYAATGVGRAVRSSSVTVGESTVRVSAVATRRRYSALKLVGPFAAAP